LEGDPQGVFLRDCDGSGIPGNWTSRVPAVRDAFRRNDSRHHSLRSAAWPHQQDHLRAQTARTPHAAAARRL